MCLLQKCSLVARFVVWHIASENVQFLFYKSIGTYLQTQYNKLQVNDHVLFFCLENVFD